MDILKGLGIKQPQKRNIIDIFEMPICNFYVLTPGGVFKVKKGGQVPIKMYSEYPKTVETRVHILIEAHFFPNIKRAQ